MCLIAFATDCHPDFSLILAANRDEFRNRETESAKFWDDAPHVLAGRDLRAGGTWIGVSARGKVAAVTNYRDMRRHISDPPSRGMLAANYLRDERMTPDDLRAHLESFGDKYDGFNLIYGNARELHYFSNRGGSRGPVKAGVHALSNHLLDTDWPKVIVAKKKLAAYIRQAKPEIDELTRLLDDATPFEDESLPETGIGLEWERFLSSLFINGDSYGTRSTTAILVTRGGAVTFCERSRDTPGALPKTFSFTLS